MDETNINADQGETAAAPFATAEEFTRAAEGYFAACDERGLLYGEAGLCLSLTRSNPGGRPVTLQTLRDWYDGEDCPHLREAVRLAYLRIQEQIESDPRYHEKGGIITRGTLLQKQPRFGGYQDRADTKSESTVKIIFGSTMDRSDFQ